MESRIVQISGRLFFIISWYTVVITTAPQRIRITKNGQNVLNKVDRASNFAGLALQPGTNVYSFAADYGDNSLHVVIRYNKQYLGV